MSQPLQRYFEEARACGRCRDAGALFRHEDGRWALPILQAQPPAHAEVLVIAEAPNFDDTFDPNKGHLTYDDETDPSGRFATELLESVGLPADRVLFTNAVLCLPASRNGKFPVRARQMMLCSSWLALLIESANPRAVITFGATALRAAHRVEPHGLHLREGAGQLRPWGRRWLLPLYHPGRLGRIARPADQQLRDIRPLRNFLDLDDHPLLCPACSKRWTFGLPDESDASKERWVRLERRGIFWSGGCSPSISCPDCDAWLGPGSARASKDDSQRKER